MALGSVVLEFLHFCALGLWTSLVDKERSRLWLVFLDGSLEPGGGIQGSLEPERGYWRGGGMEGSLARGSDPWSAGGGYWIDCWSQGGGGQGEGSLES